ncbi:TATA element modulatory factor 1 TATA binding-domain-containing protein [Biscogniauxia mediterranea]|nr:TATA element modulatory factor 1 TATA binding-domain-containing protein [Biscogniauxia mediterranea]
MSTPQKTSKWGSFLSQAVAGVEARLDNILAEEEPAKRPTEPPSSTTAGIPPIATPPPPPRSTTPSRPANDRLQERLARAVASRNTTQRSDTSSGRPSAESPRPSSDGHPADPAAPSQAAIPRSSLSADQAPEIVPSITEADSGDTPQSLDSTSASNGPKSNVGSPRSSLQNERQVISKGPPTESEPAPGAPAESISVLVPGDLYEKRIADLEKNIQESQAQHQEELHSYVERVDALQAKLQYLAKEAAEAARNTATNAPAGSLERKLAEKDQQVAQLMEEGQRLAATEQKHRTIIKKLRGQLAVGEKELNDQRIWRQKTENELHDLRKRAHESSELEKANEEAYKVMTQLKRDVDKLKADIASKENTISELRTKLQEEINRAKSTEAKLRDELREAGKQRVKELEDTIASLEVEKGLIADRAKAQATELREKADRASEHSRAVELELKGEVQILESKLEAMRARAEEASSGAVGDAQAKLLRQIETLQTQYSIASENWQGIEASLVARATSLERERDEALRRESEMRRKAREMATRAKRQEEELEEAKTQLPNVQRDLSSYQSQFESLRKRAEEAEAALAESRADLERQRATWKEEKPERPDTDKRNWLEDLPTTAFRNNSRPESPLLAAPQRTFSSDFLGLQSYPTRFRKTSAPSSNGEPSPSERPSSARRPSAQPPMRSPLFPISSTQIGTPPSLPSGLDILASPSTNAVDRDRDDVFEGLERSASPQNILQDMVSVSTMTAGPSVQLVERMSAAIRRLESEKVAAKEELARISSQRDEARGEIVTLIKEVEASKAATEKVEELEKEVSEINERYQTTLEMLGEKSELVEELRADVQDVKAMYRDLVERTIK